MLNLSLDMSKFLGNAIFAGEKAPAGCSELTKSLSFNKVVLKIAPKIAGLEFIHIALP